MKYILLLFIALAIGTHVWLAARCYESGSWFGFGANVGFLIKWVVEMILLTIDTYKPIS